MILPASYHSGFAPRDGQPLYPELWKSCVGAWSPGLGPSGLVLRDWSGYGNHGTLTNGPTWGVSGGRQALSFDGVNDYGTIPVGAGTNSIEISISFWINRHEAITNTHNAVVGNTLHLGDFWTITLPETGGGFTYNYLYFAWYNGAAGWQKVTSTRTASDMIPLDTWTHIAVTRPLSGEAYESRMYCNGKLETLNNYGIAPPGSHLQTTRTIGGNSGGNCLAQSLDCIQIHSRVLSQQEIRLLASRRGIAYELAPRRRSSIIVPPSFKAAWLNQRSQIIGGGVR